MAAGAEGLSDEQTPLVNIETAYRLLTNYQTDSATRRLVDNLDIFIVPTVNPDGALYSYYDFASQRKNLTNYCGAGDPNDINARNAWGVDNNRNQTVGSLFDGYDGASTSCTSSTFAGPFEQSEPESRNVDWIASTRTGPTIGVRHARGSSSPERAPTTVRSQSCSTRPSP